ATRCRWRPAAARSCATTRSCSCSTRTSRTSRSACRRVASACTGRSSSRPAAATATGSRPVPRSGSRRARSSCCGVSDAPRTPYPPDEAGDDEFLDATFEDVDWSTLREVRFAARRVEILRGRLTGAQFPEGTFIDATFADCRADLASFRFAKLERVVFRDCRLEEADFYRAELEDVLFERCDLRLASVEGVRVSR